MPDTTKKLSVPQSAFRFDAGAVKFMAPEEASDARTRVELVARSGEPIMHWYWGKVVHDISGCRHGDRVTFDWCHDTDEIIGYGDEFDAANDLVIRGDLVAFKTDDRASEVAHKGAAGVPYEASIFFDPRNGLRVEEVGEGVTVNVNGRAVQGPCVIFREWLLRGVAICPYGADPHTHSSFAADDTDTVSVTVFSSEEPMTKSKNAAEPPADKAAPDDAGKQAAKPAETKPEAGSAAAETGDARAAFAAELKRYTDAFGAEQGAAWFNENKPFDECLLAKLKEQDEEIAKLKTRLRGESREEQEPIEGSEFDGGNGNGKVTFASMVRARGTKPAKN